MQKKLFTKVLVTTLILVAISFLVSVFLVAYRARLNSPLSHGTDWRRRGDVRQILLMLEIYASAHNKIYPVLPNGCHDVKELEKFFIPDITASIPLDPLVEERWPNYRYGASSNGRGVVVRATLRDQDHPYLNKDVDGIVFGCDCTDPQYCQALEIAE